MPCFKINPVNKASNQLKISRNEGILEMANENQKSISNKEMFEANVKAPHQHQFATAIANRVVETFEAATVSNNVSSIKEQLQALLAAKDTDITQVIALSEKLKNNDADEKAKQKKAAELTKNYTLAEVLTAFKSEYEDLVYKVAGDLLERVTVAVNSSGKASKTVTGTTVANAEGATTILYSRPGKSAPNLMQDKDAFEFLGFKVVKDAEGEHLEPSTLTQTNGSEIPVTRPNILKAIKEGNVKSLQGFKIVEAKSE